MKRYERGEDTSIKLTVPMVPWEWYEKYDDANQLYQNTATSGTKGVILSIKPLDPETAKRYMKYIPGWA